MPKLRKRVTKGQVVKKENVKRKFRIGNRKGGLAAEQMTTEALIKVLADDNKRKFHKNAAIVLRTRPINI
jgi:hypothetical protein